MKIFYLPSGEKYIYHFFDRVITRELDRSPHQLYTSPSVKNVVELKRNILKINPDIVFTMAGLRIDPDLFKWIKKNNIKTAIWMTEDPYYMDVTLPIIHLFDYVFTIDTAAKEQYEDAGHEHTYHVSLGTDKTYYFPKIESNSTYESDLTLIGYPYKNRVELIKLLLMKTQYHITVAGRGWTQALASIKTKHYLQIIDSWIPPTEVNLYYNNAKVVLNIHRPFDEKLNKNDLKVKPRSINNRTFDIAACEAFQLIDQRPELSLYYKEKEEMIHFNNEASFFENINYYIHFPNLRHQIAANARRRTLNEHLFTHRVTDILQIFESTLV
ncbi:CgeB family protein [Evansella halocellulosilytica]|uniref:CgeB family protein n=1 Tax=Evansella halocellulosilytica TaxID=2011013 RepID=UPI000BB6F034|nr:glycosyltransferase [Evansella halocellulosilytica]